MRTWLTTHRDILTILFVSFVVRFSVVELLHADGYTSDEKEYISLAAKLAAGEPFVDTNGEWSTKAPLYPFVLSLIFRCFGSGLLLPHLFGCLLGMVAVVLSYRLCLDLLGDRFVALICASIVALYPGLVIYSTVLQTESLYIVFVLLTLVFVERMCTRASYAEAAMAGMMAALATLTRAVFFGFVPVLLLVVALGVKGTHTTAKVFVALAVWGVMLTPWTLRNYDVHGTFVPVSSWGGISMILGNNPLSNGTWSGKPGYQEWFAARAAEGGLDLERSTEIERSRLGSKLAWEFITSTPVDAARLAAKKFYMHWIYPISNSDSNAKLQIVCVLADFVVYAIAGFGFIIARLERKRLLPVIAAIVFFTAVQVVMHCEARYRLPIMPFICIFAALGASVLIDTQKFREVMDIGRNKSLAFVWTSVLVLVYTSTAWLFLSGKI